jgi:RHS repeat-associated protein
VSAQAGSNTFCPTTENIDYDGSGVRTGVKTRPVQEDPVQSTTYAWDAAASLPVIIQETTNGATTSYVYGLDLLSMSDDSDVTRYFLQDGLGSTTGLTDETGAVIGTFDYDVFGALRGQTGDADTDWRFTGEQNDPTTARSPYYLRARYYDPSIGRLLSRDPWPANGLDPQSRNPYSYVYNGPTLLVDPYGYFGLGDLKKIKDAVTDCVGDPKECAENAGQKIKQGGEAAGNWAMDNRQYIVDAIETGSGMVATASCTAGLLGGAPVCVISSSIYVGASVVEAVWIAETPAQRISAVGSSILGACGIRAGRVEGLAFAGLNGAWDALTHVDPAEAPNSRGASGPSNAGNSCVEPIGAEK